MLKYSLPEIIEIGGAPFAITNRGDYRMVLDCFSALNDEELNEQEKAIACLIIFYEDINSMEDISKIDADEAMKKMFEFFNCNQDSVGKKTSHKLIDWEKDANMVCASINRVAQTEIRSLPYLHWFTFMGYYMEIGECTLSTIVSIRNKIANNKKLEKYEKEFKRENPEFFNFDFRSVEQKSNDDFVLSLWNGGES